MSFSYSAGKSACYIKDKVDQLGDASRVNGDFQTYFVQAPARTRPYDQRSLVADEGTNLGGGEPGYTLSECEQLCDAHTACMSFSYSAGKSACYIKDKVVQLGDASRVNGDFQTYFVQAICASFQCPNGLIVNPRRRTTTTLTPANCCQSVACDELDVYSCPASRCEWIN